MFVFLNRISDYILSSIFKKVQVEICGKSEKKIRESLNDGKLLNGSR